jgi:DNA-3-methyladenine glycosylase
MQVTLGHDGADLCGGGALFLAAPVRHTGPIAVSTRIGITKDADRPLRFFERGNPHVSGPRRVVFS